MKYTNEIIKQELMRLIGFSEKQADCVIRAYCANGKLDDLTAAIDAKRDYLGGFLNVG